MSDCIMHHGIKGQKWGVRRFQNEDGSWKSGKGEAHNRAAQNRFDKTGGEGKKKVGSKLTERDKDLMFGVAGHMIRKGMAKRKAERNMTDEERMERATQKGMKRAADKRARAARAKDIATYGLIGHAIRKKRGTYTEDTGDDKDSSVTRKVKKDYSELDDKQFKAKYKTDKKTYLKRVEKYGDPYMNSPGTQWAKKRNAKKLAARQAKEDRAVSKTLKREKRIQRDIDSYKGYENGIKDRRGRELLSKQDVSNSVRELQTKRLNNAAKASKYKSGQRETDRVINELSSTYDIHYDKKKKKYSLSEKG